MAEYKYAYYGCGTRIHMLRAEDGTASLCGRVGVGRDWCPLKTPEGTRDVCKACLRMLRKEEPGEFPPDAPQTR